jgi:hypothetical protein
MRVGSGSRRKEPLFHCSWLEDGQKPQPSTVIQTSTKLLQLLEFEDPIFGQNSAA